MYTYKPHATTKKQRESGRQRKRQRERERERMKNEREIVVRDKAAARLLKLQNGSGTIRNNVALMNVIS